MLRKLKNKHGMGDFATKALHHKGKRFVSILLFMIVFVSSFEQLLRCPILFSYSLSSFAFLLNPVFTR
jgi:hypothetical protein